MTPAATTPGARVGTAKQAGAAKSAPGHRRGLRQQPAPRSPRRVSGPVRGRTAAPARPKLTPRRGIERPLGARAIAFVRGLPDHALLDRIVRGRAWIPLLGVMLAGIVAMQVEVLKLGASMGRSIQASTALQSRNELLRNSVATLADDQRIVRLGAGMGMVMPAPDGVGFLSAGSPNVPQAIANIHAPNPQGFLTLLSANGAVAAAATPPTQTASTVTASTGAASSGAASTGTASTTGAGVTPAAATTAPATAVSPAGGTTASSAAGTPASQSASAGPAAGGVAATAPAQIAPTQAPTSQSGGSTTGGAAVPSGG